MPGARHRTRFESGYSSAQLSLPLALSLSKCGVSKILNILIKANFLFFISMPMEYEISDLCIWGFSHANARPW